MKFKMYGEWGYEKLSVTFFIIETAKRTKHHFKGLSNLIFTECPTVFRKRYTTRKTVNYFEKVRAMLREQKALTIVLR